MRFSNLISALAIAGLFVGCGGSSGGSAKEDNRTSFEKLEAMEGELNAAVDKVMAPVDNVDKMITEFAEAPAKYKLSAADFKNFASSMFSGGELALPAGLDEKAAADLKGFATSFTDFKNSLMNSPDNAKALVGTLAEALVQVPALTAKVAAESAVVTANPFASAEDKAKATKQQADVKALADSLQAKIKEIQTKATALPPKAASAVGKFTKAMMDAGISSLGAAKDAAAEAKGDAGEAATDAADTAKDSATPK
ncbi:MAG: hypothetical protein VX589_16465 [Myxococcota bacterium]|nr:hypothetical protein [Myxococcota bacterium]